MKKWRNETINESASESKEDRIKRINEMVEKIKALDLSWGDLVTVRLVDGRELTRTVSERLLNENGEESIFWIETRDEDGDNPIPVKMITDIEKVMSSDEYYKTSEQKLIYDDATIIEAEKNLDQPHLVEILKAYLGNEDQRKMDILTYLRDDAKKGNVFRILGAIIQRMKSSTPTIEEFNTLINNTIKTDKDIDLLRPDDRYWSADADENDKLDTIKQELLKINADLFSMSDEPTYGQLHQFESYMKHLMETYMQRLTYDLQAIVNNANCSPVQVRVRMKETSSTINKIKARKHGNPDRDYQLANMQDLLAGRIVVYSINDLDKVMTSLQNYFGLSKIYEKENCYIHHKKSKATYRAIHYSINGDDDTPLPTEIQLTTLLASAANEFHHDVVYKPKIHPHLSDETRQYADDFRRTAAYIEHEQINS